MSANSEPRNADLGETEPPGPDGEQESKRLTVRVAVFLGVGAMVGGGIFALLGRGRRRRGITGLDLISDGGGDLGSARLRVVAFSTVNLGVVLRREREGLWSSPVFPYMGWIIFGWGLTWAAVELGILQRLLDTESLTGGQSAVVLGLSLITPALVWADKAIQLHRHKKDRLETSAELGAATRQVTSGDPGATRLAS